MTGEINQNNHLRGLERPAGPVIYSPGTLFPRPAFGYRCVYIYIYIYIPVADRNLLQPLAGNLEVHDEAGQSIIPNLSS